MINFDILYYACTLVLLILAPIVLIILLKVPAPYGRYARPRWGPYISSNLGWLFMELPALIAFVLVYFFGKNSQNPISLFFLALWSVHYVHRSLIVPLMFKPKSTNGLPLIVLMMGLGFNCLNGYLNAYYLTHLYTYQTSWIFQKNFIFGVFLFFIGMYVNIRSDHILLNLRKEQNKRYQFPTGFLFSKILCPNYFGEIIEWIGFAIATWSPSAAVFAVFTIANLLPRALNYKKWYHQKFPEKSKHQKALIPYLL